MLLVFEKNIQFSVISRLFTQHGPWNLSLPREIAFLYVYIHQLWKVVMYAQICDKRHEMKSAIVIVVSM